MTQKEKLEKLKNFVGENTQVGKIAKLTGIKCSSILKFNYGKKSFSKKEEEQLDNTLTILKL